jgi:hypothetical protein
MGRNIHNLLQQMESTVTFFSDNIDIEHIDHAAYREAYKCSQRTNNMDHIANMTTIATNSIKLIILLLQAL